MKIEGISLNSKAISKYVLLNVMEFLHWRNDGLQVRMLNKKFKSAYDLHIVSLSKLIKYQLYDKYTEDEIKQGE